MVAAPDAGATDDAADKRGAALASFPDAVLGRAGLILGPHEDIGRLPWWFGRIAAGGPVVAPGRPDRPLQYVDVRDLAGWLLDALAAGRHGPFDRLSPDRARSVPAARPGWGWDAACPGRRTRG